ncbi:MAG: glycosyltransferase family 4 protein [Candidatus Thermoplasmatota archaeon]|nr:glycosyltransferase family 4 protein [Candidatus Thermoplasmatota archaeon]
MRILWVAHRDPISPQAGGAERTIYEVSKRLAKNGHKIILLTGGWKDSKKVEQLNGIEIHRFGKNLGPHLVLPVFLLKSRYDFVVNDLGHAIPWPSSVILSKNNIVFFRHLHSRSLPGQVNPVIAKLITSIEKLYFIIYHKTKFVTESSTSRSDLINLGISEKKIIMNPPGVDTNTFRPAIKSQYPSIVYFGGMRKYKRPQESIFLLKDLISRCQDIRLFIIGTGPEEEKLKHLSIELNLQESVDFLGRVSTKELSRIISSAWLNVHTSVTEGWGYSILEASSAGTPTVAYDVPGVRDAIEDGLNGTKVMDGNRKALANAAHSILTNPEKWWSSSVKVARKYSWDKTAERWIQIFEKVK